MLVSIKEIAVPESRQRTEFNEAKLKDLMTSIQTIGLLHPVVVEQNPADGPETYVLRAGERRLRAIIQLAELGISFKHGATWVPPGSIPVTDYADLSELERLTVEVEENTIREDFNWKERIAATAKLHALRLMQNPNQTIAATASELQGKEAKGSQRTAVSDALILEKHLADPDVAKAKSAKEAMRVVEQKARVEHAAKLGVGVDMASLQHTLILGNTAERIKDVPSGSIDVILTDPPYGIGADNFGEQSGVGHQYEDSPTYFKSILEWLPDELTRVAKPAAHLYLFCDPRRFEDLKTLFVLCNWKVFDTPIIWDKSGGMLPLPEFGPRRTYETILYAYRGDRKVLSVRRDVIRVPGLKKLVHGAQKPVALYRDLLSRSALPGDTVLDCFGGSGPILVAANLSKCTAVYIEGKEVNFRIASKRATALEVDDGSQEEDGVEIDLG